MKCEFCSKVCSLEVDKDGYYTNPLIDCYIAGMKFRLCEKCFIDHKEAIICLECAD